MKKPHKLSLGFWIAALLLVCPAFAADFWVERSGVSRMTDQEWFTLRVEGQPGFHGECPVLAVSCLDYENVVAVYSPWSVQPSVGLQREHLVRLRFDDAPPREELWTIDDDRHTLMAPDPVELATVLQDSDRLLMELTTVDEGRKVIEIPVSGFSPDRGNLKRNCSWSKGFREEIDVYIEPVEGCSPRNPTFPDHLRRRLLAVPTQFHVIVHATVDERGRLIHPSVVGGENPPDEHILRELFRAAELSSCDGKVAGESVRIPYRYNSKRSSGGGR